MNVDIKSTVENKLLDRKEIEAEVSFDGATPSRKDLKQAICGKVGANPDLVVLRDVQTTYGKQSARVVAHSYSSKETLVSVEPEHIKKREGVGAEKKEEASKEEAPKEEPKKEEPKEEKKEEAPKEEAPKEEPKKEEPKEEKKEAPKEEKKE